MFAPPTPSSGFPRAAIVIASAVAVVVVAALVLLGRRAPAVAPTTLQPEAPYAASLALTGLAMSQASSFSGIQSLYIDGRLANHGPSTVTGITVQVIFANDVQMPPQIQTLPVALIRTRQPAVDTEPISAEPLAPSAQTDFRLALDPVYQSWNQQLPQIRIIHVTTR